MTDTEQASRRIIRSRSDRVFAGVCGGLAEYLDQDATLVRVAWVVVTVLAPPAGLVAYILLWLLAPEEGDFAPLEASSEDRQHQTGAGVSQER